MKKLFAVFLALMLALGCMTAVAEQSAYTGYTHPVLGYSLNYPSEWLAIDTETLPVLMALAQQGGMEGIDVSVLGNLEEQIVSSNMTMFMDVNTGTNINIGAQDIGVEVTDEIFLSAMMPMLKAQYEQMFANAVFTSEGETLNLGTVTANYMALNYVINGQTMTGEQFFVLDGTMMYAIACTYNAGLAGTDVVSHMINLVSSFTLPQ